MAKIHTLKERGTGDTIYPETTAEAVYFADGRNTLQKADELKGLIESKCDQFSLSEDLSMSEDKVLSVSDEAKRESFIDAWCSVWGASGGYDPEATDGHHFLGNGLRMTYDEAVYLMSFGRMQCGSNNSLYAYTKVRTNMPGPRTLEYTACVNTFCRATSLEVVNAPYIVPGSGCFEGCTKLREITVKSPNQNAASDIWTYKNCPALEIIHCSEVFTGNLYFGDSPQLCLASLKEIVSKYNRNTTFTITVHPEVYAKLTDEENTEWHKVLTDAIEKNISFATI